MEYARVALHRTGVHVNPNRSRQGGPSVGARSYMDAQPGNKVACLPIRLEFNPGRFFWQTKPSGVLRCCYMHAVLFLYW